MLVMTSVEAPAWTYLDFHLQSTQKNGPYTLLVGAKAIILGTFEVQV